MHRIGSRHKRYNPHRQVGGNYQFHPRLKASSNLKKTNLALSNQRSSFPSFCGTISPLRRSNPRSFHSSHHHDKKNFTPSKKAAPTSPHLLCEIKTTRWPSTQKRCMGIKKMVVFDRQLKKKQREAAKLLNPNSQEYEFLRTNIGIHLVDRLKDIMNYKFENVLDLGGNCRGLENATNWQTLGIQKLTKTDNSARILEHERKLFQARSPDLQHKVDFVHLDEEEIASAVPENSQDLVISNMNLHWVNNLPGCFDQIKHILKPDGLFLASLLGGETLVELKNSFVLAEQEREGGISAHVSPFAGVADIGNLLTNSNFALPTVDTEQLVIHFPDAFSLMKNLQGMGESNCLLNRRAYVPRNTFYGMAAVYEALYGTEIEKSGGVSEEEEEKLNFEDDEKRREKVIPATFQVIYLIGWKPAQSQPQPKQRGSHQFSLGELGQSFKFEE